MLLVEHISDTNEFYRHKKIKLSKKKFREFSLSPRILRNFLLNFQGFPRVFLKMTLFLGFPGFPGSL